MNVELEVHKTDYRRSVDHHISRRQRKQKIFFINQLVLLKNIFFTLCEIFLFCKKTHYCSARSPFAAVVALWDTNIMVLIYNVPLAGWSDTYGLHHRFIDIYESRDTAHILWTYESKQDVSCEWLGHMSQDVSRNWSAIHLYVTTFHNHHGTCV